MRYTTNHLARIQRCT